VANNRHQRWYAPEPTQTGVVPTIGNYSIVPSVRVVNNVNNDPGQITGFSVQEDVATGQLVVGFPFAEILVQNGTFKHTHGGGEDTTVCPSDGYAVSGYFVSPTSAQGIIYDIQYCEVQGVESFIATLVQ
jgi:hypothetical protein